MPTLPRASPAALSGGGGGAAAASRGSAALTSPQILVLELGVKEEVESAFIQQAERV